MTTYQCQCGNRVTTDDEMPTCSATPTCGFLFPEDECTRLQVGDIVTLHHAKGKARKTGTVESVGRLNAKIRVQWLADDPSAGTVVTTRKISDPDVRLVK